MKKRLLLLPILAALSLAGCDLFGKKESSSTTPTKTYDIVCEFASGKEDEKAAILKAVNSLSIVASKNIRSIFPDVTPTLSEDDSDYISLTKTQLSDGKNVELEWSVPQQATVESVIEKDDNHKMITFNYPGYGNAETEAHFSLAKATCGSAVTSKTNCDYTVKLAGAKHLVHKVSIGELYHFNETEQTFDGHTFPSTSHLFDYTNSDGGSYSIWWNTGAPAGTQDNFYYVEVCGKLVYMAPDGDWGLLADGSHVVQIYSGSGLDLKAENYPGLAAEDGYIKVKGNMGTYYGNLQLGFITEIKACTAEEKAAVAAPAGFAALDAATLAANYNKQFTSAMEPNSLKEVTGTVKPNSKVVPSASSKRFYFVITVGEKEVSVAYDYHVDPSESTAMADKLNKAYKDGGTITVKGAFKFTGCAEKTMIELTSPQYSWSIVPFDVSHIA